MFSFNNSVPIAIHTASHVFVFFIIAILCNVYLSLELWYNQLMSEKEKGYFNLLIQTGLVFFTVGGYLLTSLKFPQYGLIFALISQVFWLYSSYKAWKESNQIGIFITTIFMIFVISFGIFNYWFH